MTERAFMDSSLSERSPAEETARLRQKVARLGQDVTQLEQTVTQLRYALDHRPETDRVVGMLMLVCSCDEQAAWAMLSRVSQSTNRKVRDVAALISAQVAAGQGLPPDLVNALGDVLPSRAAAF